MKKQTIKYKEIKLKSNSKSKAISKPKLKSKPKETKVAIKTKNDVLDIRPIEQAKTATITPEVIIKTNKSSFFTENNIKYVRIESLKYKIIKEFIVLWSGWELDAKGYLVEDELDSSMKSIKIVLTNHNKPYIAKLTDIKEILDRYDVALKEINESVSVLSYME